MENIGAKLKDKRLEKKLSLEEISKRTKIQKGVLEALEDNKAEEILGAVYAKSFLKKYSAFLGLKTAEGPEEKEDSQGVSSSSVLSAGLKKSKNQDWQKLIPLIRNIVIFFLAAAVVIFLLTSAARFVRGKMATMHKKKTEKVVKSVKTHSPATTPVASVKKVALAPALHQSGTGPAPSVKVTPSRLLLKTKKDVWVQIKSDGRTIFEGLLKRASQEEWSFEKEMHLWVGNAAFVELTLNGKYYGSPGKGVIKDIIVTKEGIKVK